MSVVDHIKLYFSHHNHYLDVPAHEERHRATWVDFSMFANEVMPRIRAYAPAADEESRRLAAARVN